MSAFAPLRCFRIGARLRNTLKVLGQLAQDGLAFLSLRQGRIFRSLCRLARSVPVANVARILVQHGDNVVQGLVPSREEHLDVISGLKSGRDEKDVGLAMPSPLFSHEGRRVGGE